MVSHAAKSVSASVAAACPAPIPASAAVVFPALLPVSHVGAVLPIRLLSACRTIPAPVHPVCELLGSFQGTGVAATHIYRQILSKHGSSVCGGSGTIVVCLETRKLGSCNGPSSVHCLNKGWAAQPSLYDLDRIYYLDEHDYLRRLLIRIFPHIVINIPAADIQARAIQRVMLELSPVCGILSIGFVLVIVHTSPLRVTIRVYPRGTFTSFTVQV